VAGSYEHSNELSDCIKCGEFLDWLSDYKLLKESARWGSLVGLFVGWLVGWLVGLSVGRSVGRSVGQSVSQSFSLVFLI